MALEKTIQIVLTAELQENGDTKVKFNFEGTKTNDVLKYVVLVDQCKEVMQKMVIRYCEINNINSKGKLKNLLSKIKFIELLKN